MPERAGLADGGGRGECEELTGYPARAVESGDVVWGEEVIHPDDRERTWEAVQSALEADESFEVTYRVRTADGEVRWMWERGRGVAGTEGDPAALEGFITDITARRQREAELERTNTLLSTLFDALPVGVVAENSDRDVITANSRLFELFDLPGEPADAAGRDWPALAEMLADRAADPEGFVAGVEELAAAREPADDELTLADGRVVRRIHRPIEFADGDGHLWVYQDVTDSREYRRDLQRFETILETTGDPVYTLDAEGRFTYVNDTLLETTGYGTDELLGEHVSVVMDDGDIERAKADIRAMLSEEATGVRSRWTSTRRRTNSSPVSSTSPCSRSTRSSAGRSASSGTSRSASNARSASTGFATARGS
ncbi:PAS domain S-box protein [Halosegnis marinus]|uniref:PAS domain-containing protein n=1 Tax=Halosegnis marinus TaxID=3034023 RepID=UPI003617FEAD